MKYLIIFTISPVQSFIMQSRKANDLYNSSLILSETIKCVIERIKSLRNSEVIFPIGSNSLPNRIVFTLDGEKEDIKNNLAELEESAKSNFKNKITQYSRLGKKQGIALTKEEMNCIPKGKLFNNKTLGISRYIGNQINSFLKVNFIAVPEEKDYQTTYLLAEKYLQSVKNSQIYCFEEKSGRKCSICGERNIVFMTNKDKFKLKNRKETKEYNESLEEVTGNIGDSEGLCAICYGKRIFETSNKEGEGKENENNDKNKEDDLNKKPSTAYISLLGTLGKDSLKRWEERTGCDAQMIYDENFNSKSLSEECKDIRKHTNLRDIIIKTADGGSKKLPKYYALINFDGDSMGKHLSGETIKNKSKLEEFHKNLSKNLNGFASEITEKIQIKKEIGKTIYAGGDDYLGFVTLSKLNHSLKNIENSFEEHVSENLKTDLKDNEKITISKSVVVAHYKTPLNKVLKYARGKLEEVKSKYSEDKKNGIVFTYITKSNSITTAYFKSEHFKEFYEIIDTFKEETMSTKFINVFAQEMRKFKLDGLSYDEYFEVLPCMKSELKRLIKRSDHSGNTKEILSNINYFFDENLFNKRNRYSFDLENFLNILYIANKLSKGGIDE